MTDRSIPVTVICVLLCVVIVIPKSAVFFLVLVFLTYLVPIRSNLPTLIVNSSPIICLFAIFGFWSSITVIWSAETLDLWGGTLKVLILLIMGVAVCTIHTKFLPPVMKRASILVLSSVLGYSIVGFAAVYAGVSGQSLWGNYYFDPLTTLNNSAVVLSLMFWPFVLFVPKKVFFYLLSGLILLALILYLKSLSAVVGLLVGGVVIAARRFGGRVTGVSMAALAAFLFIAAPQIIKISDADIYATPSELYDETTNIPPSARHRLAMWSFAVEKIDEKPWLGWGFGASRSIPQEDRRLAPNMEIMPLHPHNMALQARLELGLPGALILAGLVFAVFYRLATFTDDGWRSGIAMAPAAAWLFVANVSYGMWQSWWIALAFLIAVIMKVAMVDEAHAENIPG